MAIIVYYALYTVFAIVHIVYIVDYILYTVWLKYSIYSVLYSYMYSTDASRRPLTYFSPVSGKFC
jgi:hypothetical protein